MDDLVLRDFCRHVTPPSDLARLLDQVYQTRITPYFHASQCLFAIYCCSLRAKQIFLDQYVPKDHKLQQIFVQCVVPTQRLYTDCRRHLHSVTYLRYQNMVLEIKAKANQYAKDVFLLHTRLGGVNDYLTCPGFPRLLQC